jgi:uncharacterized protein YuzE
MTLRIANIDFDRVNYDADADVLYLAADDPDRAVDFDETPEGHALRFDPSGRLIGITLVNARKLIEQHGEVRITLPETIAAADIAPALAGS